ncbi:MAG: hypothetical protein LBR25_08800 [Erysipelotrichaceae bacterium]|jgi:replication-associated recombination protein RarA|nr:hypothetical protein [Erysipelotrichaceae bacterium]
MAEFMSYDPWKNVVSRNGIAGEELISGLQKSIRRGKTEAAVDIAYEMYITSEQFEDKLWRRLLAISVEDVGFGNTDAPNYVYTLSRMRKEFPYNDGDRPMFFIQAIRYLCAQPKERSTDCLKNLTIAKFEEGFVPEIPDYAFDMHTSKGRAMGRDIVHFLEEASRVEPQAQPGGLVDDSYRQKLIEKKKADLKNPPKKSPNAFDYSRWQF